MKTPGELSDEQVAVRLQRGDKDSYALIIKRYQDKLMRYATYLTGDSDKAADAVQEGFIKAYMNLNGFDARKKFSSWIYRIVHNEAINILNKNKRLVPLTDFEFDSDPNPEDKLIEKELKANAHFCLKRIPVMYSEPLALYFLEDKSYEEISDILRIPMGTVGTRINRAKIIMKKMCKKDEFK